MNEMSGDAALATLDDPARQEPDPETWAANLAALRAAQPALADELANAAVPEHWRPVLGLDGHPTYVTQPPGQPVAWLGRTAAPLARARGLLSGFRPQEKNYALPMGGTGAELEIVLQRLRPHQAVYVFEREMQCLAALLRVRDWSAWLSSYRCILVPADNALSYLKALLREHPGLTPPAEIVLPDLVATEWIGELRQLGEALQRQAAADQGQRLEVARKTLTTPGRSTEPRVAVLGLVPGPLARGVARSLSRACEALGWAGLCRTVDDPRDVGGLVHVEALAAFRPTATIYVNCGPERLPVRPAGDVYVWLLDAPAKPDELSDAGVVYLAASPHVLERLRAGKLAAERVRPWFWACEPEPADERPLSADAPVLLVGDLPDLEPTTRGIVQPTHKRLWEELRRAVRATWGQPRAINVETLLRDTERRSSTELHSADTRRSMCELIEHVLLPAIALEEIVGAVREAGHAICGLGTGWQRLRNAGVNPLGRTIFELPESAARLRPRAVVVAGNADPLNLAVLQAAACGWPLLVHHPQGASRAAALGGVLVPEAHYQPFVDAGQLCKALELLRDTRPEDQQRTIATRRHVLAEHSYTSRLESLLAKRS